MTLLLQRRTKPHPKPSFTANPSSFLLSTSSPFSSYFTDLKHQHQQQPPPPPHSKPSTPSFTNSQQQQPSLDGIRRNLSEFRRRTAAADDASPPHHQKPVSFQELYDRSVLHKPPESDVASGSEHGAKPLASAGGRFSLDNIGETLKKMGAARGRAAGVAGDRSGVDPISLQECKGALRLRPSSDSSSSAAAVLSQESVFGREMRDESAAMAAVRSEFVRVYSYGELGEKLRKLRPEVKGKGKEWFSIGELNERLMRLREVEEKESKSNIEGLVSFKDLRNHLILLSETNDENSRKSSLQKFNILSQLGGTPAYLLDPPKEHLVDKYFHPDNMSSAEKLQIELAKVREEFKMSESDCGSARVQVAQLTTKIKHLSAVLHKKDVHSRKGLLAMVQRRKRLLKYLRRTDWDSYCFVISKLGLRDNPDHSHKTQKTGRSSQATSS